MYALILIWRAIGKQPATIVCDASRGGDCVVVVWKGSHRVWKSWGIVMNQGEMSCTDGAQGQWFSLSKGFESKDQLSESGSVAHKYATVSPWVLSNCDT